MLLPSHRSGDRARTLLCTSAAAVAFAAVAFAAAAENSTDPCSAIASQKIATYTEAKACLQHFPYDQERAYQTLDTIEKVVKDLYVFNEIAAVPPTVEGLSVVPVNLTHGLDIIRHDTWTSDQAFQDAIALLLDKVHDAHLAYSPYCYRQFIFWQPIQLNALIREQRLVINIAYVKDDVWPEAKQSWVGCEITKIDDRDAFDMVVDYAVNNNGESKDVNTCFNNIMNTKSYFHGWDDGADDLGYHRFLPEKETHAYTLRCPKEGTLPVQEEYDEPFTVNVPWVAQVPQGFTDARSYWSSYCSSGHASYRKRGLSQEDVLQEVTHLMDTEELKMIHEDRIYDLSPAAQNAGPGSAKGPYTHFVALEGENAKVGVIDIRSFSIANEDRQVFADNFTAGLAEFERQGVEKIILDLSGNGGGDACAGEYIINSFFNSTPDYASDVKYSPFLERVIKKAYETKSSKWVDYQSKEYSGADWYTHPAEYDRGGQKVKFSQPITLSCHGWDTGLSVKPYTNTRWTSSDILILSDGRCGSTCAIVASRLHLSHDVPAMGLGGIRGNPMQFASFPGGESERLSGFLLDLQSLGLQNDPEAPQPFPQKADMGWTFREAYRPLKAYETVFGQTKDLLEYSATNADCRMHFNDANANDITVLWGEVAQVVLSGQCPLKKGASA
ncbi:hypothetical protein BDF14DRAFT_1992366 [Spinellus fusiger]|nr:hypothetical protein BDF14DRAFT_1992366 [Spinellus fusiger]